MRRRNFLLTGLAAIASPRAWAQADRLPRIGVLVPGTPPRDVFDALRDGLEALGYVDGKTVRLDVRWNTDDSLERWNALAAELVDLNPAIIVSGTTASNGAVKRLTEKIPIVSPALNDPVRINQIQSFARPGGSITGLALITPELIEKRIQLAVELMPNMKRIGVLWRVDELGEFQLGAAEAAARALGLETRDLHVRGADDLERTFASLKTERVDAVIMMQAAMFRLHRARIVALAKAVNTPVVSGETGFAADGGLMNYGASIPGNWRRAAVYVDKIMKGAKPGDLPVEQPVRYELVVNIGAARAFGLEVPFGLLSRADEVIE